MKKSPLSSAPSPDLLRQERHPCAGNLWVFSLHGHLRRAMPFPTNGALPVPPNLLDAHLRRVERELRGQGGRAVVPWVWLSPEVDPFTRSAAGWDRVAIQMATLLLERGVGVLLRTRGGRGECRHLVQLAGEHPGRLEVDVCFFSGDARTAAPWEQGTAPIEDRLALVNALTGAGARVRARLGPLVPMINDDERPVRRLASALLRQGVRELVPEWITGSPGLDKHIERQVSRARSRMVRGWLHMEGAISGRGPRTIPDRVRRPILRSLHGACGQAGVDLITCACNSPDGLGVCTDGPPMKSRDRQFGLFSDLAESG